MDNLWLFISLQMCTQFVAKFIAKLPRYKVYVVGELLKSFLRLFGIKNSILEVYSEANTSYSNLFFPVYEIAL